MILGIEGACARRLRHFPQQLRVSVVPNGDGLVPALAAGMLDWIAWSSRPAEETIAWCTQVLRVRPLSAACTIAPASDRVEVLLPGTLIGQVLGSQAGKEGLAPHAARVVWLDAWARALTGPSVSADALGDGAAWSVLLACMIHPSTEPLHKALGVSKEYVELLRKRLGYQGFRGPGRIALASRVVSAWEWLRVGRSLVDVSHMVGYSGVPAMDRALVRVAGAAALELTKMTEIELARRLRAAIRRRVSSERGQTHRKRSNTEERRLGAGRRRAYDRC